LEEEEEEKRAIPSPMDLDGVDAGALYAPTVVLEKRMQQVHFHVGGDDL
jgi:hypothetical protein